MKIQNDGYPRYAGGQRYEPDAQGFVEIPDDVARAEGLLKAEPKGDEDPEKTALVDRAIEIGVLDDDGKRVFPSVLKKWAPERLLEAIAKAENAQK